MQKIERIDDASVTWDSAREVFRVHRVLEDGSYMWFKNCKLVCLEDVRFIPDIQGDCLAARGVMVLPSVHEQKITKRTWFNIDLLKGKRAEKAMLMIHTGIKNRKVQKTPEVRMQIEEQE